MLADYLTVEAAESQPFYKELFSDLDKLGYVRARNLTVNWFRSVEDAVKSRPHAVLTLSPTNVKKLQNVTKTVPIVTYTGDLVASGFALSLSQPGGNVTGVSADAGLAIYGKYLEILREIVPSLARLGLLTPRVNFDGPAGDSLRSAAEPLGISVVGPALDGEINNSEYRRAIAAMVASGAEAMVVSQGPENAVFQDLILDLAQQHRLPATYPFANYVSKGGLVGYVPDGNELRRHLAECIAQVFSGRTPAEIPIYQTTRYRLLLNSKTAEILGIRFSPALLARADEVIE